MNLYAYTGNDPVNFTDPSGETALIGAFVGGVIEVIEIKARGGDILSKEGLLQVGKGVALGAVGAGLVSKVSKGVQAVARANNLRTAQQSGKLMTALNNAAADGIGSAAVGVGTEAGRQVLQDGEVTDLGAVAKAGTTAAIIGTSVSSGGQAVAAIAKSTGATQQVSELAGAAATVVSDIAVGACSKEDVSC